MKFDKKARALMLKQGVKTIEENLFFFIGFGILVGSIGLILGAFTVLVSSLMIVHHGWELVPAMVVGFGSVGVLSFLLGLIIILAKKPR